MEQETTAETFDTVGLVRELARKAHPDAVPELIDGADAEAIAASIEPARAAFARLKERIASAQPAGPTGPARVPAGGNPPAVDPERLPANEKIRRGLASVRR